MIRIGAPGSGGERELEADLRECVGNYKIPGIALLNTTKPAHADAFVITPKGSVLIEVKSIRAADGGTIEVHESSQWTMNGEPVDLCLKEDLEAVPSMNPIAQADGYASKFGPELKRAGLPGAWISVLIVIVQHHHLVQRGAKKIGLRNGRNDDVSSVIRFADKDVTVTTLLRMHAGRPLRRYLRTLSHRSEAKWDIESVHRFLEIIDFDPSDDRYPSAADLEQEGFSHRGAVGESVLDMPRRTGHREAESTRPAEIGTVTAEAGAPSPAGDAGEPRTAEGRYTRKSIGGVPQADQDQLVFMSFAEVWRESVRKWRTSVSRSWRTHRSVALKVSVSVVLIGAFAALLVSGVVMASRGISGLMSASKTPVPSTAGHSAAKVFQSPSGNIVCEMSATSATCTIGEQVYHLPQKPRTCHYPGYGRTVTVEAGHSAIFACRAATSPGNASSLAYGKAAQIGKVTCRSATNGVTCSSGKHGFQISRHDARRW